MKKRRTIAIVLVVLLLWLTVTLTDFYRVTCFEKPVFSVLTDSYDDGGSGKYIGLGYYIALEGNFMPEDEFPGVTRYHIKLIGIHLKSGIPD